MLRPTTVTSRGPRAEDVVAHVDERTGRPCQSCSRTLIGHDAVLGLMLGFRDRDHCARCLAERHGQGEQAFLESAARRVARLACYRAGWRHADQVLDNARRGGEPWPEERVPSRLRMTVFADDADEADEAPPSAPFDVDGALSDTDDAEVFDAGSRGCGELALELKLRIERLENGSRLMLITSDAGAPADIPAWCGLTGNALLAASPPRFLIERRETRR